MKQFEKLTSYPPKLKGRLNSFIVTEFDDSMTVEMQLRVFIKWIRNNIDLTNDMVDYLNNFILNFDENLLETVEQVFIESLEKGEFDHLFMDIFEVFREETLEMLNDKLAEFEETIDKEFTQIKTDIEKFKADLTIAFNKLEQDFIDFSIVVDGKINTLENSMVDFKKFVIGELEAQDNKISELTDSLNDLITNITNTITDINKKFSDLEDLVTTEISKMNLKIGDMSKFRSWDINVIDKLANESEERMYNCRWFGVNPNTDITTTINDMFKTLGNKETPSTIFFPKGTYHLTGDVEMQSNLKLISNGDVHFKYTITNDRDFCVFHYDSKGKGYENGIQNVLWNGFNFYGSVEANNQYVMNHAFHHGGNIHFENCNFYLTQGKENHTIDLVGVDGVTVHKCKFYGTQSVSDTTPQESIQIDFSYRGGLSWYTPEQISYCDGLPTKNVTVSECEFLPYNGYPCPNPIGQHSNVGERMIENIYFINNLVDSPRRIDGGYGIIHFWGGKNIQIIGNNFIRNNFDRSSEPQWINITTRYSVIDEASVNGATTMRNVQWSYCQNIRIENNTFTNMRFDGSNAIITIRGIHYHNDSNAPRNQDMRTPAVRVCNNQFEYVKDPNDGGYNQGMTAIIVSACYAIIENNTINRCQRGIWCQASHINVSNNQISRMSYGGILTAGCTGVITDNLIHSGVAGIRCQIAEKDTSVLMNNVNVCNNRLILNNNTLPGGNYWNGGAIYLTATEYGTCVGNSVKMGSGYGYAINYQGENGTCIGNTGEKGTYGKYNIGTGITDVGNN